MYTCRINSEDIVINKLKLIAGIQNTYKDFEIGGRWPLCEMTWLIETKRDAGKTRPSVSVKLKPKSKNVGVPNTKIPIPNID